MPPVWIYGVSWASMACATPVVDDQVPVGIEAEKGLDRRHACLQRLVETFLVDLK
jgi:hypothetical protein